jgi:hypothetical protein
MKLPRLWSCVLALAWSVSACDQSPVQPLRPVASIASSAPSLEITGSDVLYPPSSWCSFYHANAINDDGTSAWRPTVTWTLSDIRVIRFEFNQGSTTITTQDDPWVCGLVGSTPPGYGYAAVTARWTSPGGTTLTATKQVEFGQTFAGYQPVNVFITPLSFDVRPQQTVQLTAFGVDQFAHTKQKPATWDVDLPAIATVNQTTGVVTGVSKGDAHVSATVLGTTSNPPATITVLGVTTVSVDPSPAGVYIGAAITLTATPRDQRGNVVAGQIATWTSSDANIATVASTGNLTASVAGVAEGQVTIVATINGVDGTSVISVTAAPPPAPSVSASVQAGNAYLSWAPVPNVTSYRVYRRALNMDPGGSCTTNWELWNETATTEEYAEPVIEYLGTNSEFSGLPMYAYRVSSVRAGLEGSPSVTHYFRTWADQGC